MLHGMIPAAFFATLLRRYLDSLSESPDYNISSSSVGCLGTSAVLATVGMAAYGLARLSKKKPEIQSSEAETKEIRSSTPQKKESCLQMIRKPKPKRIKKKRHRKNKQWLLDHMRYYKSKYGRQIGKLMNQFLGIPLAEPPMAEPVDLDNSDEEIVDDDSFKVFGSFPYSGGSNHRNNVLDDIYNEDNVVASKDHFADDGEDTELSEMIRKRSSSLDLKELLRDNFEIQMNKQCSRRVSDRSHRSRTSSGSYKSYCSDKTTVPNSRSSSKKSRSSSKKSRFNRRSKKTTDRITPRNSRQHLSVRRNTRSGRCYNGSTA
ncbi:uncharacterized protein LOC123684162 [Harmonia axyridis]|uniref:uncharacterized protein LOC123684162 n=1 Tax=Harmonia axyridis TaxID=115357 RepID=UPI001E278F18|nr:uncharacterized protein LOC123684162 [Harmonia axyridis]